MRRLVSLSRLQRRLAITFALVAAVSTGMLALGTYLVVREARLDDAVDCSVEQARQSSAGERRPSTVSHRKRPPTSSPSMPDARVSRRVRYRGVSGSPRTCRSAEHAVPAGVRRLVLQGDLAFERVRIADTPDLVAGGEASGVGGTELYFFFSEESLRGDVSQLRTILLVGLGRRGRLSRQQPVPSSPAGSSVRSRQASEAAHALAEGLLETRLPVTTDDELGVWAASFNEMAEALEEKIRALSEAQARERRFTADVAHELRTPLTALAGEAGAARGAPRAHACGGEAAGRVARRGRRPSAPPGRRATGDLPARRGPGRRSRGARRPRHGLRPRLLHSRGVGDERRLR